MRDSKPMNALALLVTAGAGVGLWLGIAGLPARPDRKAAEASGWAMAQEAVRHLKEGGRLLVIERDTDAFKHPEADYQSRAFAKAVRQAGGSIAAVQALQLDPLRPPEVPPGDFFELIRRAPAGSVIVSFMGPPLLSAEQRAQLGTIKPRIVAFCPGAMPNQIDLRILFDAGLLHTAVISRPPPRRPGPEPGHPQGRFDRHYRLVTAADVAGLYEGAPAR